MLNMNTRSYKHSEPDHIESLCFSFLILFLTGILSLQTQAEELNYLLAPDDTLSIIVYEEPDLSIKHARVATNGTVAVPLLGQIKVAGLSIKQVEEKLTGLFADGYLKKPAITVSIDEYRLFYINGEVKKPGGYSYRDGLTVHKAVTLAQGFSERAAKNSITVMREGQSEDLAKRVKLTDPVHPGDIITVKESFF